MVTAAFGSAHILFLSTPSARRATWYNYINKSTRPIISIHALREEGDPLQTSAARLPANFYPRPPRGGRPARIHAKAGIKQFLSTPSARRATMTRP